MSKLGIAITTALAVGLGLGASAASAQGWGYDRYQADHAYRSADVRNAEARRDQHAAAEAAYYGDYAAANHYARAADRHRYEAWRDARYARHEDRAARWNAWHRGY